MVWVLLSFSRSVTSPLIGQVPVGRAEGDFDVTILIDNGGADGTADDGGGQVGGGAFDGEGLAVGAVGVVAGIGEAVGNEVYGDHPYGEGSGEVIAEGGR